MTYKQTKLLTFLITISIAVTGNIFAAYSKTDPTLEGLIITSIVAIIPGLLVGLIAWGIRSIYYLEKMLNKTTLTDKQVGEIWCYSCRYPVNKSIGFQDFLNKVDRLVGEVSDKINANGADIYSVAVACMCIHYTNLWKGNWCGDDPGINKVKRNVWLCNW